MKHVILFFALFSVIHSSFGQCNPPTLSVADSMICASDSSLITVQGSYTSYLWNTGETTNHIYAKSAGGYWVTTTDNNNCTAVSAHSYVFVYPVPSIAFVIQGDTLATFGSEIISCQWYKNGIPIPGATSLIFVITESGYYSLVIVDINGCRTESNSAYIEVEFKTDLGSDKQLCQGSNVILDPVVQGGRTPFTYAWSANGSPLSCYNCERPQAVITQSSTYTVTVTDYAFATTTATVNYTVSGAGTPPSVSVHNSDLDCIHTVDTTTVTVINASGLYSINWGDGENNISTTTPVKHYYKNSGEYIVSISDAGGCSTSVVDTIKNRGIQISFPQAHGPHCSNGNDGSVSATVNGGTPAYSYFWSNGELTNSIQNLTDGTYKLTVTDATSCSSAASIDLHPAEGNFFVYLEETAANCNNNGAVNSTVYGGAPPFHYLWTNNSTNADISGLAGGVFSVEVTDSIGCKVTGTIKVGTGCHAIISGTVFNDDNNNCVFDGSETAAHLVALGATQNGVDYFYGYTDKDGHYSIDVEGAGTFRIAAYNYSYFCGQTTLCGNATQMITVAAPGDTLSNNDFGFVWGGDFDLGVFASWKAANPGFPKTYEIFPYSGWYMPFTGTATVVFTYDPNLLYQSSVGPAPVNDVQSHTLTWNLDSVPNYINWGQMLKCTFMVPANLSLSYELQSTIVISPIQSDCNIFNNTLEFNQVTTGSFDPNEKTVSPANYIYNEDSILTYTIHFQNTGTDSTHFVIVKDSLPPDLDPATVRTIASSHPYSEFTVSGAGILKWVFNPLRLVDSLTNPEGSKGFVMFTIKKRPDRAIGSVISNKASIYFDYNQPVLTNRATDTVSVRTDIGPVISRPTLAATLSLFPNPSANLVSLTVTGFQPEWITVYDVNGKKVSQQKFAPQINVQALSAGIYFVEVKGGEMTVRKKLVRM